MWALPGEIRGAGTLAPKRESKAVNSNRATRRLKPHVAAYIAGFVDGEGTVTLTHHHEGENRRLVVSVANTERQLLEFLCDQIGAGKITRKRTVSDRHAASFCYSISSRQALGLLEQIAPFMLSYKRRRAELALASYRAVTPRNGKYSVECKNRRSAFEVEFFGVTANKPRNAVTTEVIAIP